MSETNLTPPIDARPITRAPGYRILNGGEIWSCLKYGYDEGPGPWHIVKPRKPSRTGHLQIELKVNGKGRVFSVHRLVLEAFVGPCPPGCEACHYDGNPANNFVSNLRWDTRANNHADKKRHGTDSAGERNRAAKLKEHQIPEIFELSRAGLTLKRIAEKYGVHLGTIHRILSREKWSHVQITSDHVYTLFFHSDLAPRGERHGNAKITEQSVIDIFRLSHEGLTRKEIAEIHSISKSNINFILSRKTWSHVPVPAEYLPAPR